MTPGLLESPDEYIISIVRERFFVCLTFAAARRHLLSTFWVLVSFCRSGLLCSKFLTLSDSERTSGTRKIFLLFIKVFCFFFFLFDSASLYDIKLFKVNGYYCDLVIQCRFVDSGCQQSRLCIRSLVLDACAMHFIKLYFKDLECYRLTFPETSDIVKSYLRAPGSFRR